MKTKSCLFLALTVLFFLVLCKKEKSVPQLSFTNNVVEGIANNIGEYTVTGHIS